MFIGVDKTALIGIKHDNGFGRVFDQGPIAFFIVFQLTFGGRPAGNITQADDEDVTRAGLQSTCADLGQKFVAVGVQCIDLAVSAVAKDGIQVRAIARVTVRANIERLVVGAGEETIIARVGEGIVSTIGSSETHKAVLENPDSISRVVLAKGLDSGTAFEILSIDIADVDVGENIGAKLQTDQADADLMIARAKAEERRAAAVAAEQEISAPCQRAHTSSSSYC